MKKLVRALMLVLAMVILIIPVFAFAEDAHPPDTQEAEAEVQAIEAITEDEAPITPGEPLTWAYLATIAGATAATLIIVQFLKVPLDRIWKIPTRAFVYVVALVLLLAGTYFTTGLTVNTACLTAVNAVIVALTAYGSYEVTFRKIEKY